MYQSPQSLKIQSRVYFFSKRTIPSSMEEQIQMFGTEQHGCLRVEHMASALPAHSWPIFRFRCCPPMALWHDLLWMGKTQYCASKYNHTGTNMSNQNYRAQWVGWNYWSLRFVHVKGVEECG